jgi:hypothetical protein
MSHSYSTSIARRSNSTLKRLGGSAHGKGHPSHAVGGAVDSWRAGVQVGQEPTAVEMAPGPFLGVVVDAKLGAALWTGEPSAPHMLSPHVDPAPADRQLDPAHPPEGDPTHQASGEPGVTHGTVAANDDQSNLANISSSSSPTQNPQAPSN